MKSFKSRIKATRKNLILANDYTGMRGLEFKTIQNIKSLHPYLCAIKINLHLLLPLGTKEISKITRTAHKYGLQTIADIKLNDIGSTNQTVTENLFESGFDAIIVNPIMGVASLKKIVSYAHKNGKGVITLCHMSAPEAKSYELDIRLGTQKLKLYELFLEWAVSARADGVIAGATFPKIIQYCKKNSNLNIYSPGIGTQGGSADKAMSAGTDYMIVGRTILNSKDPVETAKSLA